MDESKDISLSLKEYGRGIAGGLLFSLPMLYTMELWWIGFESGALPLLIYFLVGILLLMVYNHYVGIRRDHSLWEGLVESMEEMGLGLILTLFILWVTHRITLDMSINEISGKIIVEAVTVAIGISVGKSQLGAKTEDDGSDDDDSNDDDKGDKKSNVEPHFLRAINISLCGAILIASNIAPTDEVVVIALEAHLYQLLIIAFLSVGIGGTILYYINFKGSQTWVYRPNKWKVLSGIFMMYAVSLVASAFMLWFFGRFDDVSIATMVSEIVVLGFPAALGASAGRLLIQ